MKMSSKSHHACPWKKLKCPQNVLKKSSNSDVPGHYEPCMLCIPLVSIERNQNEVDGVDIDDAIAILIFVDETLKSI